MKNISKIFLILFFFTTSANSEDNLKNIKSQLDRLGNDLSDLQLHVYNSSENNFSEKKIETSQLSVFDIRLRDIESELKALNLNYENVIFEMDNLKKMFEEINLKYNTLIINKNEQTKKETKENENIDFNLFNEKFNQVIADLDEEEKSRIIVNCRKLDLLQTLTDTTIQKSLESDDAEYALQVMEQNNINILVIKLEAMNEEIKSKLNQQGYSLGIYNVKTRKENNKALGFAPDFVISDNIDCTLKSVNGKE